MSAGQGQVGGTGDPRRELEAILGPAEARELTSRLETFRAASEPTPEDLERLRTRLDFDLPIAAAVSSKSKPRERSRRALWVLCGLAASLALVVSWRSLMEGAVETPQVSRVKGGAGGGGSLGVSSLGLLRVVALTGRVFVLKSNGYKAIEGSFELARGSSLRAGVDGCELGFGRDSRLKLAALATAKVLEIDTPCFELEMSPAELVAREQVDFVIQGERFRCQSSSAAIEPCCEGNGASGFRISPKGVGASEKGLMRCAPSAKPDVAGPSFQSCATPQFVGKCRTCGKK